jgi:hypothetical protein
MSSNDDPLAGLASQLNEDSKASRRRKPATPKTETAAPELAEDGRTNFTLKDQDLADFRQAMADDDESLSGDENPVSRFWRRMAAAHGFDVNTLLLVALPDDGPIEFNAIATTPGVNPEPNPATDQTVIPSDEELDGIDNEARQSRGLQLMQHEASSMDLASATLVGDLSSGILKIAQSMQKPWSQHSQFEKRDLVTKIEEISQLVARKAVDVVAADDRVTVKAILDKINIGDKITINLTLGAMSDDQKADAVAQLFHAQKKSVLIVTADSDRHMGRRRTLVEEDEVELPFDAGSDPKPAAQPPVDLKGPPGDEDLNPDDPDEPDAE